MPNRGRSNSWSFMNAKNEVHETSLLQKQGILGWLNDICQNSNKKYKDVYWGGMTIRMKTFSKRQPAF